MASFEYLLGGGEEETRKWSQLLMYMVARIQESMAIDGHGPEAPRHAVYIRFDLFHPM